MGGYGSGMWIRQEKKRLVEACHAFDIEDYFEKRQLQENFQVEETPCHFGGQRTWLLCPGEGCGRRVTKLYRWKGVWLCRRCHSLAYRSQLQPLPARLANKARRLRIRLGDSDAELFSLILTKPAQMKLKTYEKIVAEVMQAEIKMLAALYDSQMRGGMCKKDWRRKTMKEGRNREESRLTDEQRRVIALLAEGFTDSQVVQAVGISEEELRIWRNQDSVFLAELNYRRRALWENCIDQLRGLVPNANAAIRDVLTDSSNPQRWRAAMEVIKVSGLNPESSNNLGQAIGSDDPKEIERKMKRQ